MPAVCEEKGLPYVYTPSRFKRARLCLFLKTCKHFMMPKRDYLALAACVAHLISSLPSSGKTWELPWAWREVVWWWWYGSMKTTRSCMTKLKQRSRLCPRPSSVELPRELCLSRQTACICDLGMHASIFVRNLGCLQLFLNFIFFSCNSVVVVSLDLIHQL